VVRNPIVLSVIVALASVITACDILDIGSHADPALIVFYNDTADIDAPNIVNVKTDFDVSVTTFAGGCTRDIDHTSFDLRDNVAEIRPFNRTKRSDVCTADLLYLVHTVTLRFDRPGVATIRVLGSTGL